MDRRLRLSLATLLGTTTLAPLALAQTAQPPAPQPPSTPSPPASSQCGDTTTVRIPIAGQIGPDGQWHPSRAPRGQFAVGGGPCPPPGAQPEPPTPPATSATSATAPSGADATAATTTATTTTSDTAVAPPADATSATTATSTTTPATTAPATTVVTTPPHAVTAPPRVVVTPPVRPVARGGGPWMHEYHPAPVHRGYVVRRHEHFRPRFVIGGNIGGGNMARGDGLTNGGLAWSGGLGVSFANIVTLEGRYEGFSTRYNQRLGLDRDAGLIAHGATGLLRLTLPVPVFQPFVQAGAGWYHFVPQGDGVPAALANVSRNVGHVPVGGGVELRFHRTFALTGEFLYRFVFDSRGFEEPSREWGNIWTAAGGVRLYL